MRLNRTSVAFFLILVVAVSFVTLFQRQKIAATSVILSRSSSPFTSVGSTACSLLTFPTVSQQFLAPFILDFNVAERSTPLFNNSTRVEIYDFIKANPGVQFRGICSELGLSIGLAEFHLGVLKKAGLISFIRDGRYKRFFESKKFSQKDMEIISLLRHDTTRCILKTILDGKRISHGKLACQLSITSQGLTWQINRLRKVGVLQESKEGMKVVYSLDDTYASMLTEIMNLVEQT